MKLLYISIISLLFFSMGWHPTARADLREGQKARLFEGIDEKLQPVDMANLIDGRPLVLIVGSCT